MTLKEQRTLVLAARETPLSTIHLRNMHELSTIPGVRIIPPMLTYYIRPESVEDFTVTAVEPYYWASWINYPQPRYLRMFS